MIVNAPVLGAFASQAVLPGEAGSSASVLTSRSNVPVDFCFAAYMVPGDAPAGEAVVPAPSAPPLPAGRGVQTATMTQPLSNSKGGMGSEASSSAIRLSQRALRDRVPPAPGTPHSAGLRSPEGPPLAWPITPIWLGILLGILFRQSPVFSLDKSGGALPEHR
jgi:hypothetical protein